MLVPRQNTCRQWSAGVLAAVAVAGAVVGGSAPAQAAPALPYALPSGTVTGPFPVPEPAIDYPAATTCAFALRVAPFVNQTQVLRDTDSSGRVVAEVYYGTLIARATNLANGRSERLDLSASGLFRYAADGSTTIDAIGPYGLALHPGDAPGPFYAVPNGYSRVVISATGTKTVVVATQLRNVCSDLG